MIRAALTFTALLCGSTVLRAQEPEVSPLEQMVQARELRLQEQRAAALRTRLVLYSDELQKLRARWVAQKNTEGTAAVDAELASIQKAVKVLNTPAAERLPDEKPEMKNGEAVHLSTAASLARRIDGVMKQFGEASSDAALAGGATGKGRTKVLKIEDAKTGTSYSGYEDGRDHWVYEGASATWSVSDMQPGLYEVELRYRAGEGGGGAVMHLKAAEQKLTVNIARGENFNKTLNTGVIGTIKVTEPGMDLRVEGGAKPDGMKYYWDLREVILRPAGSAAMKPKSP